MLSMVSRIDMPAEKIIQIQAMRSGVVGKMKKIPHPRRRKTDPKMKGRTTPFFATIYPASGPEIISVREPGIRRIPT